MTLGKSDCSPTILPIYYPRFTWLICHDVLKIYSKKGSMQRNTLSGRHYWWATFLKNSGSKPPGVRTIRGLTNLKKYLFYHLQLHRSLLNPLLGSQHPPLWKQPFIKVCTVALLPFYWSNKINLVCVLSYKKFTYFPVTFYIERVNTRWRY